MGFSFLEGVNFVLFLNSLFGITGDSDDGFGEDVCHTSRCTSIARTSTILEEGHSFNPNSDCRELRIVKIQHSGRNVTFDEISRKEGGAGQEDLALNRVGSGRSIVVVVVVVGRRRHYYFLFCFVFVFS